MAIICDGKESQKKVDLAVTCIQDLGTWWVSSGLGKPRQEGVSSPRGNRFFTSLQSQSASGCNPASNQHPKPGGL